MADGLMNADPTAVGALRIAVEPVFTLLADVEDALTAHEASWGSRRLVRVRGGRFTGSTISGQIEAGGADHQLARPDGVIELDVRLVLTTDEGERLSMNALGLRAVDPAHFYFRQMVRLETSSPRHAWMNARLFIGTGRRLAEQVELQVYELF